MHRARPITAVTTGGTARGKTRNERRIGTIRPILTPGGEVSGEYAITGNSGYTEATLYNDGPEGWTVITGDPHDMDSPKSRLPGYYDTRADAVVAAARHTLLIAGEQPTYIKCGETR
ncbi:hypothetical protein OHA46_34110 (plasmid) [Streptomyces sp. NBC_00708]|uniref:hypothetical protein n=1 Tax=Streptomyces sp. NBC_01789 TaxID=2975941 RepID=UPI002259F552|nr:hypothetical protein [Streptomyces sp. NBC_01789]MCX4451732.1 hypothetical protein [Streptomyces sp. NBC_01789]